MSKKSEIRCKKCNKEGPEKSFRMLARGRSTTCEACYKKARKESLDRYYFANSKKLIEKAKARAKDPEAKKVKNENASTKYWLDKDYREKRKEEEKDRSHTKYWVDKKHRKEKLAKKKARYHELKDA